MRRLHGRFSFDSAVPAGDRIADTSTPILNTSPTNHVYPHAIYPPPHSQFNVRVTTHTRGHCPSAPAPCPPFPGRPTTIPRDSAPRSESSSPQFLTLDDLLSGFGPRGRLTAHPTLQPANPHPVSVAALLFHVQVRVHRAWRKCGVGLESDSGEFGWRASGRPWQIISQTISSKRQRRPQGEAQGSRARRCAPQAARRSAAGACRGAQSRAPSVP